MPPPALRLAVAIALVTAACDASVSPTASGESPAVPASGASASPNVVAAQVAGAWRRSPVVLADSQIAIVSDACADAARKTLGEAEANLPTAVVDARGEGFVTAILSDGDLSIVCAARLAEAGASVDSVDRLSRLTTEPQEGAGVSVVEFERAEDRPGGGRTIAYGRVGPDPAKVKLTFDDDTTVTAAKGEGWWAAWWPGAPRPAAIAGVDQGSVAIGSARPPAGLVESRLGKATWWLDPPGKAPAADAMTLSVAVREEACASGKAALDRLDPPQIDFGETAITVRLDIRLLPGPQDCVGNPPFRYTLELPEAVGGRKLLDGSTVPPRDATKAP